MSFSELEHAVMLFRDQIINIEDLKFGNNLKKKKITFALKKLCEFFCFSMMDCWKNYLGKTTAAFSFYLGQMFL